jgi:hypothetical protein
MRFCGRSLLVIRPSAFGDKFRKGIEVFPLGGLSGRPLHAGRRARSREAALPPLLMICAAPDTRDAICMARWPTPPRRPGTSMVVGPVFGEMALDLQHDLAERAAFMEVAKCFGGFRERISPLDDWPDRATCDERHDLVPPLAFHGRCLRGKREA